MQLEGAVKHLIFEAPIHEELMCGAANVRDASPI